MAGTLRDATHSRSPSLTLSAWLAMVSMAGAVSLALASTLYRIEPAGKAHRPEDR